MKRASWVFVAGAGPGLALGMVLGMWGARVGEDRHETGMEAAGGSGHLGSKWQPSGGVGSGGTGLPGKVGSRSPGTRNRRGGMESLIAFTSSLSRVDDIEEVNFMEVIRELYPVTQMSEGEIVALMASIQTEEFRESLGDNDDLQQILSVIALSRMAEVNGPKAMRFLIEAEPDTPLADDREEFAAMVLTSWVGADPRGALRWLQEARRDGSNENLQDIVEDPDFNTAFVSAMARADRDLAASFLDGAEGEARALGLEAMSRHEESAEGVRNLLESTGEEEVDARRGILETWSERDPKAAAAWLDEQPTVTGRPALAREIARNYLAKDPPAAAEWFMQQDLPAKLDADRCEMISRQWAYQDHEAAGRWLEQQDDGPSRDSAEAALASSAAYRGDWGEAFAWAGGISDGDLRDRSLGRIMDRGVSRDREGKLLIAAGLDKAAREAGFGDALDAHVEIKDR